MDVKVARSIEFQLGMIITLTGQERDNLGMHFANVLVQASSSTGGLDTSLRADVSYFPASLGKVTFA